MTAIIGIKTNKGLESVVIGADTQISVEKEDDDKNKELPYEKKNIRKIICGENWIMAFAGTVMEEHYKFYKKLSGSKRYGSSEEIVNEMIANAVKNYDEWKKNPKKYSGFHFKEVADLNATLMRRKNFDIAEATEGVLAVYLNDSGVRLFHVDEFGNLKEPAEKEVGFIKEFDYVTIGAGAKRINRYISDLVAEEESGQFFVNTRRAIEIIRESIHRAGKEIQTGGNTDLTVLTKRGVDDYSPEIKEALKQAEDKKFEEIERKYDELEEELPQPPQP